MAPDDESRAAGPGPHLGLFVGRPVAGVTVVTVTGEIDIGTAPVLREALDRAAGETPRHLVLDVGPVSFFSSAGISELLITRHRAEVDDFGFHLCSVADSRPVTRVLQLTGLLKHFTTHLSTNDALADIAWH